MNKRTALRAAAPSPSPLSLAVRLAHNGILSAAVGVFAKKGAVATRVEDLLKAADVARRTFYKYFGSKEDVLASLYELATADLVRAVQAQSEENRDPLVGLHRGIDFYLDYHVGNAALIKVLVEHAIPSDSALAPLRRRFRAQLVELMASAAERATGTRPDPLTCIALLVALEGTSLYLLEEGEPSHAQIERAKKVMHGMLDRVIGARS
jgi:AcrR family transcriptional regulator